MKKSDMDKLEEANARNAARVDILSETIQQLTGNVSQLSSSITSFSSKIDAAEKLWNLQLNHLTLAVQASDNRITNLEGRLEKEITKLDDRIDPMERYQGSMKGAVAMGLAICSAIGTGAVVLVEIFKRA